MKWFTDMMTGIDGTTHDLGRWSWVGSHLAVTGAAIFSAATGHVIGLMELAGAHAAVATAHGAALFIKKDTEPK